MIKDFIGHRLTARGCEATCGTFRRRFTSDVARRGWVRPCHCPAIAVSVGTRLPGVTPLATIADGHYTLFLLAAESVMAIAALAGGCGVLRGYWWGMRVAHVAIGLMLYSTVYTRGGSLVSEPFLKAIMLGGLAGTLTALGLLWQPDIGGSFRLDRRGSG